MNICVQFIKHILQFGNFKSSNIPRKYYRELLTELENLKRIDTVFIPQFIELAKNFKGRLVIDDTNHPKYGLKNYTRKLKNLKTSGYENGFKLLLFLWEGDNFRIPLGFALWHKEGYSFLSYLTMLKYKRQTLISEYRYSFLSYLTMLKYCYITVIGQNCYSFLSYLTMLKFKKGIGDGRLGYSFLSYLTMLKFADRRR